MSYLVPDFIINPVLRQARRFSRSSLTGERTDTPTTQESTDETTASHNVAAISEIDPDGADSGKNSADNILGRAGARTVLSTSMEEWCSERGPSDEDGTGSSNSFPLRPSSSQVTIDDTYLYTSTHFQAALSPLSRDNLSLYQTIDSAEGSNIRFQGNSQAPGSNAGNQKQDNALPEDDGMGQLRQRIVAIQKMDIASGEKARLMHQLLTEKYRLSQLNLRTKLVQRKQSPLRTVSLERPTTPTPLSPFSFWQKRMSETPQDSSPKDSQQNLRLSKDDLRPAYVPIDESLLSSNFEDAEEVEQAQPLGCQHYKRNVKLQCFTCNRWYTCRFCHDEAEDHRLSRKETRNMLCMLCGCAQKAGDTCVYCGIRAAWYYCNICHLWDDDMNKSIYHCNDCGICRKGRGIGKDYVHCKTCGVCVAIAMEHSHKCIERASDCDCPICGEYLFSSPQTVVFMKCGHSIHRKCYDALMETSYKCPICSQSLFNMETQFRNLDRAIESQPMPPQFQDTKATVSCNDCYAKSLVKYHWLGLKCAVCDSYNTVQLQVLSDRETDLLPVPSIETSEGFIGNNASNDLTGPVGPSSIQVRNRRHSTHVGQFSAESQPGCIPLSPPLIPQRIARSLSPTRRSGTQRNQIDTEGEHDEEGESEEDDVDFWGRDGSRSITSGQGTAEGGDSDDSEEESSVSTEESLDDGDDGDEEDCMDIFGHR